MPSGQDYYDEKLGVQVYLTKETVTDKNEIEIEIDNFNGLGAKACPFFKALYDAALKKHLEKALSAKK
jgi:hypothetical protein